MSVEHLKESAAQRSAAAEKRVRRALTEMARSGAVVNFSAVAREADVSTDFLYRHPKFRQAITEMRTRPGAPRRAVTEPKVDDEPGGTVRALAQQLRELKARYRAEVAALKEALAAAHGENLELRRLLDAHGIRP